MKIVFPSLMAAALLVGGCGTTPDPWMAEQSHAASATAGIRTLLRSHWAIDEACAPLPLPAIAIPEQSSIGTISVDETVVSVPGTGTECDGQSVTAVGIFYEAPAGTDVVDTVTYIELSDPPLPDNTHTVHVRVR
jgi:hypothetical protein